MAASDARPIPRKNIAFRVTFPILDADGDLVTGASALDTELSGDGGTFADATNEATEIATSSGMYYLDLTYGEMNYDTVAIIVKTSTSGAKTTSLVLYPEEAGDTRCDAVQISGDSTAADNLESACDGGTYNIGGGAAVAASVTGNVGGSVASIASNGIAAASIATGAITNAKFAAGAIDAAAIATGAIDDDAIATDAITAAKIAASAIGSSEAPLLANLDAAVSTRALESGGNIATILARIIGTLAAGTHNSQSGDAYSRLGVTGSGLTSLAAAADMTTLLGRIIGTLAAGTHNPQGGDAYARIGAPILASISADIASVLAKVNRAVIKNTALSKFMFLMTDSTNHAPATGKTVTCTRSINGGAFGAGALSGVGELSNGVYYVDFAAGDLNGKVITLRCTAAGCDDTFVTLVTED